MIDYGCYVLLREFPWKRSFKKFEKNSIWRIKCKLINIYKVKRIKISKEGGGSLKW
jgi:hypothetical protein